MKISRRRLAAIRRFWANPRNRRQRAEQAREQMVRRWADPKIRARIAKAVRQGWRTSPDRRQAHADSQRSRWLRPGVRKRLCQRMRMRWTPARRKQLSRLSQARWRNPRLRQEMTVNAWMSLGPSMGARRLHGLLGSGWFLEFYTDYGFIDIANPLLMIAVEVDGRSHRRKDQRIRDRWKERGLRRMGWTVYRVPEEHARAYPSIQ